jgi:hypothetical protein
MRSKKEGKIENGSKSGVLDADMKRPVSREDKRQRVASWRAGLSSHINSKDGDMEKYP